MNDPTSVPAAERQITITRVFDAPPELVFRAWTDPDQVARWFGPAGFETPRDSVEIDLRVGGGFSLRMVREGSGPEHPVAYEIVEFTEPELLVLKSEPMPEVGLHHGTIARIELQRGGRQDAHDAHRRPVYRGGGARRRRGLGGRLRQARGAARPVGVAAPQGCREPSHDHERRARDPSQRQDRRHRGHDV